MSKYGTYLKIMSAVCASLLVTGCVSKTTSIDFTHSEVQLIPSVSLHNLVSLYSTDNSRIMIETMDKKTFPVKQFINKEYALVTTENEHDRNVTFREIAKIKLVKKVQTPEHSSPMTASGATEGVVTLLAAAPVAVLAVGTWPLLKAMGLDSQQNSEDGEKAQLIYVGLSKTDLLQSIGDPKIKYHCISNQSKNESEIWVYDNERVLRGGRALFIDFKNDIIYHNSFDTTFFIDSDYFNCSPIQSNI